MSKTTPEEKRISKTISFFENYTDKEYRVLDLGIQNKLSKAIANKGFKVTNTLGEDLDLKSDLESQYGKFDIITAFEILEHLVSPFELLRNLPSSRLIATVPLRLWFSTAYRNPSDKRDRHFHEFEDWQFDWLLEKSGWKIIHHEKWKSPSSSIGIRPVLRSFYFRYYAVYAERY